ncbi:hypothetical protein [Flavobacterium sp.]|uniref:hypothetical protein n=1 Tax=Flavobacterium sp. TaxID=239 RepID=UPI0031D16565
MAIQTLNTIKKWFQTGFKPSQNQFWDTWDSFRHKHDKVPFKDIEELETILNTKIDKSQFQEHKNDINAHTELLSKKEDTANKGIAGGYAPLDEFKKIANQYLSIIDNLTTGGSNSILSAEQGVILKIEINKINALLASNNLSLNTLQKVVDAVEGIQTSLNNIFVNDLTTGGTTKALTAEMGKFLQANKEDKSQKGISGGYAPLNNFTKLASQYLDIVNDLVSGGSTSLLSAEQGKVLQNQINGINTILKSDNINLDTIQEIVDAIEEVQLSLNAILVNDLTTGGATKALTAEMGKMLENKKLTATIATDSETQITSAVTEDNKVISRSKLFNWWENLKTTTQTIKAVWNFNLGIKVSNSTGNILYTTQMIEDMFIAQLYYAGIGGYQKTQYGYETIKWISPNNNYTQIIPYYNPLQNNILKWPNKSGTVAVTNDFITTAAGTISTPPLIIPNGTLTTTPQNGAIERDSNGKLWTTHDGKKYKIIEDDGSAILLAYNSPASVTAEAYAGVNTTNTAQTVASQIGSISNNGFFSIKMFNRITLSKNTGTVMPNVVKLEVFMQVNNGFFYRTIGGPRWNQLKIYEKSNLSIPNGSNNTAFYDTFFSEIIETSYTSWSGIILPLKTDNGSSVVVQYTDYSLTNASNNADLPASQASFNFVFAMTLGYADSTNASGQNVSWKITNVNKATYIEKIR